MKLTLSRDTVLTSNIIQKILEKDKSEVSRFIKLEEYYQGNHIITSREQADADKPNNKVVNPYCSYITDTLVGYFVGEPITYASIDEDALQELTLTLTYNDSACEDTSLARDASIFGVAYELLYIDGDGATRFAKVSPKDMIIIYDDTIEQNILYAIRKVPLYDIMTDKKSYRIEVYSSEEITIYEANQSLTGLTHISTNPHYFNDVPVVEYKNNEEESGDFEKVIPLIDSYDILESDSLNDYDYFVDAYLMLTGVSADAEDIAAMRQNRVLLLDEDSKAEWLIKNSNDNTVENLKNRVNEDIHKFAKVPNLADESFSSNASGIAIKFKLYGTETVVSNKERYFKKGLQRRIELIFNIINLRSTGNVDWRAIDIQFTRNMPNNETEIADVVQKLSGLVSSQTLLAQIPFVENVQTELERLQEEKEENPFYDLNLELNGGNTNV